MSCLAATNGLKLKTLAAVFLLFACSVSTDAAAEEPTLEQVMEVPAPVLAQGYLWVKTVLKFLSLADAGATVQLPGETITKNNIEERRGTYEKRLGVYWEAIKRRGYRNTSGKYRVEITESCGRIRSNWVSVLHELGQNVVDIGQEDMDAQIKIDINYNGRELSLNNKAAIAESSISVVDSMNSDYFFLGDIKDKVITIRPDPSVTDRWPEWAGPPSRSDVERCAITLEKVLDEPGTGGR